MKIAIIGFPGCGKSTCFKAITQRKIKEAQLLDPSKPHQINVKVTDSRLEKLKTFFNPKKTTPAEIIFEDLPGFHIPQIKDVEALAEVLGMFSERDPVKDIRDMEAEFILSDTEIANHRLGSLEKDMKKGTSKEKQAERDALIKCKETLEKEMPLRDLELTKDEEKVLRGFQFLSRKPLFIIGNIDEKQRGGGAIRKLEDFSKEKGFRCIEFCAKLEAEIADLEESEKEPFLKELGIDEAAWHKVIALAYDALGYVTFFTVKGSELRAWPVPNRTTAIEAAGKIHSDIQRGFIKAEVINFDDLLTCGGSLHKARKKALLKLHGKEYKICDGDIIDFKFNV